jgi:salicylate hydroxylase
MVGHRASLVNSLYEACLQEEHIQFFFSAPAEDVSLTPTGATITFKTHTVEADILLGVDGIKSQTRVAMLKELQLDAGVTDTGQAAYRIMLTREQMSSDPELLELIDADQATRWIGEKRHIIAYPVSKKQIYNISTAHPDTNFAAAPSATYTTRGSKASMLALYSVFGPKIRKMLDLVPEGEVCEWKLRVHSRLPTWVYGVTALAGDACHPTLPHLAQGAAQAIEDAAVLGVVLSKCPDSDPRRINKCLRIYESIRKERAETLIDLAAANGRTLHLGEGAAKAERDKQFAALKENAGTVPDKWADANVQKMIYGHDCMQVAMDSFDKLFSSI